MNPTNPAAIQARLKFAADVCARHGAQLTDLRRSVLGLILQADQALTAYRLLDRLQETRRGAVPPTVYRALDFLLEQGLIHRVECLHAFVPCIDMGHPHHVAQFLICRGCGSVLEIEDPAVSRALTQAAAGAGFRTRNAVVEIEGTCATCAGSA